MYEQLIYLIQNLLIWASEVEWQKVENKLVKSQTIALKKYCFVLHKIVSSSKELSLKIKEVNMKKKLAFFCTCERGLNDFFISLYSVSGRSWVRLPFGNSGSILSAYLT